MMISSTPFKVKLGLRDQGVGQVWKTNWSWQFQWTTSSCCSCMVLGYWMFTCFRSNFVWWSPHYCRCTYTKCWPLDTDLPLPAGYSIKEDQQWHFIMPQQRSRDGMDWWIFQETWKKMRHPNNSKRETSALTFHSKARLWLSSTTEISMLGRYYKSITQALLMSLSWPALATTIFSSGPSQRTWPSCCKICVWFRLWSCAQEQDMANWQCEVGSPLGTLEHLQETFCWQLYKQEEKQIITIIWLSQWVILSLKITIK